MFPVLKALLSSAAFALSTAALLAAADHADPAAAAKPYPFDTCIVSGEAFGGEMGEPVVIVHEGREVTFCCKGCIKTFTKDPARHLANIDQGAKDKADGRAPVNPATLKPGADEKHE